MMEDRVAIIDLGTNTFLLLIAERANGHYQIVHQHRIASKIGLGGINGGVITPQAVGRAILALKEFRITLDEWKVSRTFAFGTSAIRNAKNRLEFIHQIKIKTEIEVKIISGDEEAELIYLGVRQAVPLGKDKALIIDIGGGSVECIIANTEEIFWKRSFEIGGQRLLERFQHHDPILPEEIRAIQHFLKESLAPLLAQLIIHQPETLVGSSGTFDTLSDIFCEKEGIAPVELPERPLSLPAFDQIFAELKIKNRAQRLEIPGMIELRVDMIVVACCLIQFLLQTYSFKNIRVSSFSLKEGALAKLYDVNKIV
jgi:exopolyphosphatase/guanosine-5'-triphosphate,3'-diphosphate pyrophosphatase